MPQMKPMNWLNLFIIFYLILMILIILNFFSYIYMSMNNCINFNKMSSQLNWKW